MTTADPLDAITPAPVPQRSDEAPPELADTRRKLIRGGIVLVVLIAGAALALTSMSTFSQVLDELGDADQAWIAVAIVLELVAIAGFVAWTQTVYRRVPHDVSGPMLTTASGANAIVPGAGTAGITSWLLYRLGMPGRRIAVRASTAMIANSVNNAGLIVIVGVLLWVGVLEGEDRASLTLLPAAVAAAVIALVAFLGITEHRRLERGKVRVRHHRVALVLGVLAEGVTGTLAVFRRARWRLIGMVADTVGNATVLWAALQAVHASVPWGVAAMGYLIGKLMGAIPVPGGIGVLDLGITGALVLYGVRAAKAGAGDIIAHAIYLFIPILVGLVAIPLLRRAMARFQASGRTLADPPAEPAVAG